MGSLMGGGDSGPSKEEIAAQKLRDERERQANLDLAKEQDRAERQRQAARRRGRGLGGQTTSAGAGGFTLFSGKDETLG